MQVLDYHNYYGPYHYIAIYALYGIPGQQCFYVGKSRRPWSRFLSHLSTIDVNHNLRKTLKIHAIAQAGGKVGLCVIEWVPRHQAAQAEFYWIGELERRGIQLTNSKRDMELARAALRRSQYQPSTPFESISKHDYFVSQENFRLSQDDIPEVIANMRNESQKTLMRQMTQGIERLDADGLEKVIVLAAGMLKTKIPSKETMLETSEPLTVESVDR